MYCTIYRVLFSPPSRHVCTFILMATINKYRLKKSQVTKGGWKGAGARLGLLGALSCQPARAETLSPTGLVPAPSGN